MYLIFFAFVSVTSAWVTWRHNPLYSTWSTLRFLGVLGLAFAALAGLIVGAVNLTGNLSEPVRIGTMLAVSMIGALGLIFIIISLSTPRATALPASVPLLHMHRRRVYMWGKRAVIAIAVVGIAGAAIPGNLRYVVLSLAGMMVMLAPVMLGAAYIVARDRDHALTALEVNPWIHWRYSPEQWKEWTGVEVDRGKLPAPPKFHWKREWPAVPLVLGLLGAPIYLAPDVSWQEKNMILLAFLAVMAVIGTGIVMTSRKVEAERRADLLTSPPEAYLGPDGLFCDGVFSQWMTANEYLTSAAVDDRPPRSLMFRFDKIVPGASGGNTVVSVERHVPIPAVPIPAGRDGDIARLQQELAGKCPKAKIMLG